MWIIRPRNSYIEPTPTPTITPSVTANATPTPTATNTPTLSLTATCTLTPTQTLTPTITLSPTVTLTPTNTATVSSTNTPTPTVTNSQTPTNTVTITVTNTPSNSYSATPTPTNTSTVTPTVSYTPTVTPTQTYVYPSIGINSANYNYGADWAGNDGNVTTIGTNGGPSSYGTYDQSGNVWEWTEGVFFSVNRGIRGGSWRNGANTLKSNYSNSTSPTNKYHNIGFRIASINNENNFMNYLQIANTGNAPDTPGYGAVSYLYMMNRFEVTNNEYVEFLNSIASISDQYGLYNSLMSSDPRGGINRTFSNNTYTYSIKLLPLPTIPSNTIGNKPVNFVNWFDAARYCNWLHNNKPSGLQNPSTTENGAYPLNGTMDGTAISRNINAKYFIPTESEWYKSAYFDKNTNLYWSYATQNNIDPGLVSANISGDGVQP